MKRIKRYLTNLPIGVKLIVGINLVVYFVFILTKIIFNISLETYFGAYPTYSENFNVFSIFTSMFVHSFSPLHIIMNMGFILVFSPFVERKLGTKLFITSYFIIGLMGYMLINYSYHQNKISIEKSIGCIGIDVNDIKVVDGLVSHRYLFSLSNPQSKVVVNYDHIISKTYGASSALFGIIILYILFNLSNFKKVFFIVLGTYLVVKSLYLILNSEIILNGTGYAHFGGMIGGVAVFIWYKLKKGIV